MTDFLKPYLNTFIFVGIKRIILSREISIKFSKICFNEVNTWLESINLK